jgi:hypothetical protein
MRKAEVYNQDLKSDLIRFDPWSCLWLLMLSSVTSVAKALASIVHFCEFNFIAERLMKQTPPCFRRRYGVTSVNSLPPYSMGGIEGGQKQKTAHHSINEAATAVSKNQSINLVHPILIHSKTTLAKYMKKP